MVAERWESLVRNLFGASWMWVGRSSFRYRIKIEWKKMALNIKNPEADILARKLAALTGESITDAVISSLRERYDRKVDCFPATTRVDSLIQRVRAIQQRVAQLPVLDTRTDDEIIGYNEFGGFD